MTNSHLIATRFMLWAEAVIAAHAAAPCSDATMDRLNGVVFDAAEALAATPAETPGDVVLKMWPLVVYAYEPGQGENPMHPNPGNGPHSDFGLIESILSDMRRIDPTVMVMIDGPQAVAA